MPILKECVNDVLGTASGDFSKSVINGATLSFAVFGAGMVGNTKLAVNSSINGALASSFAALNM